MPKIDFSPYLKKSDAENTYQPKGNYVKDLNFKDKLLSIAGVKYSIEDNGYICFGPLFGGLIIQWGKIYGTDSTKFILPVAFNKKIIGAWVGFNGGSSNKFRFDEGGFSELSLTYVWLNSLEGTMYYRYVLAIGW